MDNSSASERLRPISERILAWTEAHGGHARPSQGDSTRIHRLEQLLLARAMAQPLEDDRNVVAEIDRRLDQRPMPVPAPVPACPPGLLLRLIIGYTAILATAAMTCGLLLVIDLPGMLNIWPLTAGAGIGAFMALAPSLTCALKLSRGRPHPAELAATRIAGIALLAICVFALRNL